MLLSQIEEFDSRRVIPTILASLQPNSLRLVLANSLEIHLVLRFAINAIIGIMLQRPCSLRSPTFAQSANPRGFPLVGSRLHAESEFCK